MNESRRAHYRGTLSAAITATSRGFTGTFKNSVWGEFKTISKQREGLRSQQLCLLRSAPWLGCASGCGKPQSIHQNRQSPTVNNDSKGCQERWSPSMAASISVDKDFFFIIIILGWTLHRKKAICNQQNWTEDAKTCLGSIHIQQSWGAFTDWTNYPPLDVSHSIQSDQLQLRVIFTRGDAAFYHTNMSKYVNLVPSHLWTATLRGHMSDFKNPLRGQQRIHSCYVFSVQLSKQCKLVCLIPLN